MKYRQRHALVDTDGRALVLFPNPASIQGRDGADPVLQASKRPFPFSRSRHDPRQTHRTQLMSSLGTDSKGKSS